MARKSPNYFADEDRAQRNSVVLRDVDYAVDVSFQMTERAGPEDNPLKFDEMFRRRLAKGQYHMAPYLGCREFPATVTPYRDGDPRADRRRHRPRPDAARHPLRPAERPGLLPRHDESGRDRGARSTSASGGDGGGVMILQTLVDLAKREGLIDDPDFEPKPVRWVINLGPGGKFLGVAPNEAIDDRTKKAKPRVMQVPRSTGAHQRLRRRFPGR